MVKGGRVYVIIISLNITVNVIARQPLEANQ